MRIGLIGPAEGCEERLRSSAEFLLEDADVQELLYLGIDDCARRMIGDWEKDLGSQKDMDPERAALLRRVAAVRTVPMPPARGVEMIEDRIVLVLYDKSVLDAEDIANTTLIVYGKSEGPLLKRFGRRYFFTPGPLLQGTIALIEHETGKETIIATFDTDGSPLARHVLSASTSKLLVSG